MKRTSIRWAALPGAAVLALTLAACGGRTPTQVPACDGGASGSVAVDGSSTVFPMSNAAYELLSEENPDIKVTVGSVRHRWRLREVLRRRDRHLRRLAPDQGRRGGRRSARRTASSTPSCRWPPTP